MRARRSHPVFSRLYARMSHVMEQHGYAERRRELLAGLSGSVIEIGAGNGLNFAHYPRTVTAVLAVEPEPHLRRLAQHNAQRAPVCVRVIDAVAEDLPAAEASFDAAVTSLVLCSVRDQPSALHEIHRVLKRGGELRFFEHVRAGTPALQRVQRLLDRTVWPRVTGGCHTSRDTAAAITSAGFRIDRLERFPFPPRGMPQPTSPHVIGVAHAV